MQHPTVAWEDGKIRIVSTVTGAVIEVVDGRDAMGAPVWRRLHTEAAVEPPAEGWKELCEVVGLEPAQWRRLLEASQRREDPAPVRYDPWGKPVAVRAELRLWRDRNTLHARLHKAVRVVGGSARERSEGSARTAARSARRTGTTR